MKCSSRGAHLSDPLFIEAKRERERKRRGRDEVINTERRPGEEESLWKMTSK